MPLPTAQAFQEAGLAALGDKRSRGNKTVPLDAIDFIVQWAEDQIESEIEFHRNDMREELLLFMSENYPAVVKTDEPGNNGWFTCSEDFMRTLEDDAQLSSRRITSAGSDDSLPPGMTETSAKELMRARLATILYSDPDRPIRPS